MNDGRSRFNVLRRAGVCFVVLCLLAPMPLFADEDGKAKGAYVPEFPSMDWLGIRKDPGVGKRKIALRGYLSFDGIGDGPNITMWEKKEDRENKNGFCSVTVHGAHDLINDHFGWGTDQWRVLEGMYVEISGEFEPERMGFEYGLGKFESVSQINVMNNGQVLVALTKGKEEKPEKPEEPEEDGEDGKEDEPEKPEEDGEDGKEDEPEKE